MYIGEIYMKFIYKCIRVLILTQQFVFKEYCLQGPTQSRKCGEFDVLFTCCELYVYHIFTYYVYHIFTYYVYIYVYIYICTYIHIWIL